MFTSLFLTIGLIHLIALASPGPDFALILRTSLHRPTALGAALGIAIAILLHATLSLTGISLLIASQPWLFLAVKVVGALYLGWLGWGAIKAARRSSATQALRAGGELQGWNRGLRAGIATNLLNPDPGPADPGAVPALPGLVRAAGLEPLHRPGPAPAEPGATASEPGHRAAVRRRQPLHPGGAGR